MDSSGTLEQRIGPKYVELLDEARERLARLRSDESAGPFEIADAERLVTDLEFIVQLPRHDQAEIATADALTLRFARYYYRGEYDRALLLLKGQLEIRRRILGSDHQDVATSLDQLATLFGVMGDLDAAEPICREALAMRQNILGNDHPSVAGSLNNLAGIFFRRGYYAGAEQLYREALAMLRNALGDQNVWVAGCLGNLAKILQEKGDLAGAESLFRQAYAIKLDLLGNEHPDVAKSLVDLAGILLEKGNLAEAEPFQREALAMLRQRLGNESPYVALGLSQLGAILETKGEYAEAVQLYREALDIIRIVFDDEHPVVSGSLQRLATLLAEQGDYARAESLQREALAIDRKHFGSEHPYVAAGMSGLGRVLNQKGDHGSAEPLIREALAIRRKLRGNENPSVAASLEHLAALLKAKGEYKKAEPYQREALSLNRRLVGNEHPYVVASLTGMAELLMALKNYASAESVYVEAAGVYEVARLRVGSGMVRAAFLDSPYSGLAGTRLALGKTTEAWPAVETDLGRVLAELLQTSGKRQLSPAETAREHSLKQTLGKLERELGAYRAETETDTSETIAARAEETRNSLLLAEAEWGKFQQTIRVQSPVGEGRAYPLERIQAALDDRTAIVGWLDVEERNNQWVSWGYVIRNTGPVVWERLTPADDVASPFDRTRKFRTDLFAAEVPAAETRDTARILWKERLAPLERAMKGVAHLIVIPSGAMLGVPVEALLDETDSYVGDIIVVSYAPSATVHAWSSERARRDRPGESDKTALLVGDPPYNRNHLGSGAEDQLVTRIRSVADDQVLFRGVLSGNRDALARLPRIPGTRKEVTAINKMFSESLTLLGSQATEQELVRMALSGGLEQYDVLHFATHALTDDERPDRSALIFSQVDLPDELDAALAGERIYDGKVTAKEIVREWELDADLVTLSGCQTALGKAVGGEGYIGLAHAFLQVGARSLLVSLWDVEDKATSLLMQRFYENYTGTYHDDRLGRRGEPMPKAQALAEAKRWLCAYTDPTEWEPPYAHPYYWAGFVLIGDPS